MLASWPGWELSRRSYLFGLAAIYLALVLVNLGFRYVTEMGKGVVGERVLRRLRFDLFALYLETPPDAASATGADASVVVIDEVSQLGDFVSHFSPGAPLLRGGAALAFMLSQNVSLGLMALAIVCSQGLILPWLRREQARLTEERGRAQRRLGLRLREAFDGLGAVRAHAVGRFERAQAGHVLHEIFQVRLALFRRKFSARFLNTFVVQSTPFLFYAIGGYLGLPPEFGGAGALDLGQLVAVIAAFQDLPGPVQELIDWDQHRLEAQVRYEWILRQATPTGPLPDVAAVGAAVDLGSGDLSVASLRPADLRDAPAGEGMTFAFAMPAHCALVGPRGGGRDLLARVLGRQVSSHVGRVTLAGRDLATLPDDVYGAQVAFVGPDPSIFSGTIRDNVVFGLRSRAPRPARTVDAAEARRRREAKLTGNPTDEAQADWIDYAAAGARGPRDFDRRIVEALRIAGVDEAVFALGLAGRLDPVRHSAFAARVVEARRAVREALARAGATRLVEPFDPARYALNASIRDNLLFGLRSEARSAAQDDAVDRHLRDVLRAEGLEPRLTQAGRAIVRAMADMFTGRSGEAALFDRFSFIAAHDLPRLAHLAATAPDALGAADRDDLAAIPLAYVEPRHRLGVLDPPFRDAIVAARARFQATLPADAAGAIEFYHPDRFCAAAPVRDNLLFGHALQSAATAGPAALAAMRSGLDALDLSTEVFSLGLDRQIGDGRGLSPALRSGIDLARALVKRPRILVLDDAVDVLGHNEAAATLARVRTAMAGRTVVASLADHYDRAGFDVVAVLEAGVVTRLDRPAATPAVAHTEAVS